MGKLELFTEIVNRALAGVLVYRLEVPGDPGSFRLVMHNEAARRQGMPPLHLGKTLREVAPRILASPVPGYYLDALENGKTRSWTIEWPFADGRRAHFDAHCYALDEEHVVVWFHDVTARATAERALAASEARHEAIKEAALDAIIVMDAHGLIESMNGAAERTFGYQRDELIGRSLERLIPERLRAAHTSGLQRYLATQEPHVLGKRVEMPALRKDGSEFVAEIAVVRIRVDGPPTFTGYIRDITDRIRAREADELQRSKEAIEQVNAELEAFSDAVAHDLHAPLRALQYFAASLLEDAPGDDTVRRSVERISGATANMHQIIDGLLSLSKEAAGELVVTSVDVSALARSIVTRMREASPGRSVDVDIAEGIVVRGDARMLAVLLQNLLSNAWKFTQKTAAPRIVVTRPPEGTGFVVRDNGVGFAPELAPRLFMPFQRLHVASDFAGTGIGLATAARIVRRHSGRITATGTPGHGAVFTVYLPG